MRPEVFLSLERSGDFYASNAKRTYHVGLDPKHAFCGAEPHKLETAYGDPKEEDLCKTCAEQARLPATALLDAIHIVEDAIAALRGDIQSLYAHGPINRAIAKLATAASEIMDEAKDRALSEVDARRAVRPKRKVAAPGPQGA